MWWAVPIVAVEARADVVDRVVAVVEDQPLLQSEVRLVAAMGRDPSPVPGWTALHPDPLEDLVDATMIRLLAADVGLYQPTREQVAERLAAFRATFERDEDFDRFVTEHGLDGPSLENALRRRMIVERYLLRNLVASPSDVEAWARECRALLDAMRPRLRVRVIELRDAGPP
jgi:hypothetical protein